MNQIKPAVAQPWRELSKLAYCRLTKVDRKDVYLVHCLAKRALLSTIQSTDVRGTPFWIGATADLRLLFM